MAFAAAVIAVFAAAAGQAVTAIGFSLVAVPFVSLAVGPAAAVPTMNLLAGGLNIVMLLHERQHVDWRAALRLFVPAAIVIPIVGVLIKRLNTDALSVINGVAILGATALLATGWRAPRLRGRRGAALAGATSGAMNVATSVGGPPIAMYAVNAEWPAQMYRPTVQAYFLAINILSFAVRGLPHVKHASLFPALALVTALGWASGSRVARRVDDHVVRNALLVVAAIGGAVAVLRGLI
ncbi:MAG TPA: sulfite exporter TauE/SafE family protein [Acidimicrobiales bacterium]|nr:sulfite exporter TauE/SafE family protein [Acidimicrobiales bacterium]